MLVLNLQCEDGHGFEGWFGSAEDFEGQQLRGLLSCPVCGHANVQRLPSAPRLNVKVAKAEASAASPPERLRQIQAEVLSALRRVAAQSEDVGERFAEEARRIHYGEAEERGIRGQASGEQIVELAEEGIAVLPLPATEPLQ